MAKRHRSAWQARHEKGKLKLEEYEVRLAPQVDVLANPPAAETVSGERGM
jgi:hypothetical protein